MAADGDLRRCNGVRRGGRSRRGGHGGRYKCRWQPSRPAALKQCSGFSKSLVGVRRARSVHSAEWHHRGRPSEQLPCRGSRLPSTPTSPSFPSLGHPLLPIQPPLPQPPPTPTRTLRSPTLHGDVVSAPSLASPSACEIRPPPVWLGVLQGEQQRRGGRFREFASSPCGGGHGGTAKLARLGDLSTRFASWRGNCPRHAPHSPSH